MATSPLQLPRAVLFDYDGVLVASEPIHLFAWMQLLDELGFPQDREAILKSVGRTAPEILSDLLDRYRPGWSSKQFDVHQLAQRKNDFYVIQANQDLRVYPGVEEGLRWLRSQKVRLAVVSNARRRELEKTMKKLGLFDQFDEIVSRDDAGIAKPDPRPYLFAAAALGIDPSDCLAIEDSPTGLEAALIAQIPAAAVTTHFTREILQAPVPGRPDLRPIWVGASIQEFFECLRQK